MEENKFETVLNEVKEEINTLGHTKEEAKDFDRQRQEANLKIIKHIIEYINSNPQIRFIQALWILDITNHQDRFNEEPQITLKRIETRLEQMKEMKERINLH